jgi:hypothetical protein
MQRPIFGCTSETAAVCDSSSIESVYIRIYRDRVIHGQPGQVGSSGDLGRSICSHLLETDINIEFSFAAIASGKLPASSHGVSLAYLKEGGWTGNFQFGDF